MGERDEFDRIVEGLDLDLGFMTSDPPDEPDPDSDPVPPVAPARHEDQARSPDVDEEFYRRVDAGPQLPWRRNVTLAWIGIVGSPTVLVLCTLVGFIAPRSVVTALALVFVASAVYLISQLPDRNPGDGPDDGAVI